MAVLTPDYERMQNSQPQDFSTIKEYRDYFRNQDIDSAQSLITSSNDYLVMDADKLNDLCDTIDYMQQIWDNDKTEFADKYLRLTKEPEAYDSSQTYNVGDLVSYNGNPFFCISDDTTGAWDVSKWIKIGGDDVGLVFAGQYDPPVVYPDGVLVADGETRSIPAQFKLPVTWEYKMNDSFMQCGATYPNIRYLTSSQTPYANEIYMTEWDGGSINVTYAFENSVVNNGVTFTNNGDGSFTISGRANSRVSQMLFIADLNPAGDYAMEDGYVATYQETRRCGTFPSWAYAGGGSGHPDYVTTSDQSATYNTNAVRVSVEFIVESGFTFQNSVTIAPIITTEGGEE